MCLRGQQAEDADSAFGGPLALRRKYYNTAERSGTFSCMLWCTIALGAMTSNMNSRLVCFLRVTYTRRLQVVPHRGCRQYHNVAIVECGMCVCMCVFVRGKTSTKYISRRCCTCAYVCVGRRARGSIRGQNVRTDKRKPWTQSERQYPLIRKRTNSKICCRRTYVPVPARFAPCLAHR